MQRARAQRLGQGALEARQPARRPAREPHQLRQLEPQPGHRRLALGAALVQGARSQLVPRARVDEQQLSPDRDVPRRERGALEQQRVPRPRQRRAHLVHDAAPHTHIVVLGAKRHACELAWREPDSGEHAQRLRRRDRQRGRGGEPGADRHVARHSHAGPRASGGGTRRVQLAHHAGDVRGPPGGTSVTPIDARRLAVERRDQLEHAVLRGTDGDAGARRRRQRQHGTAVVVGVLADQVDPPGRRGDHPRCLAERRAEQG